jgi:cytochrome c556
MPINLLPMILLLVIATWIVVLFLIAALCAAARVGDREPLTRASAPAGSGQGSGQAEPLVWEPAEHGEIAAHANARAVHSAQADASLLRSGDMAA